RRAKASGNSGNEQMLDVHGAPGTNAIPSVNAFLAVNLQYGNTGNKILADGVIAAFGPDFTNQPGMEDASKMANSTESVSIVNAGNYLSIDARQMPVSNDTIFLNMSGLVKSQYTLQIFADQAGSSFRQPWLQDNHLNTLQLLSLNDTNNIVFNVNSAVPSSSSLSRFRIVFSSPGLILPVKLISIHAVRADKDVRIDWKSSPKIESGHY
ncbi:MAG TPA: hypothetical protein VK625_01735, partial [Flavitalea sp.]|nr:hypothetical protein [Flavitalea sp.]